MSLTPGTRIGKYTVRRKLAEGGMAEIFLCAAEGPEGFAKEVVVKRVRPFLTDDPAFISMFIDEARLASRLSHPNVVQIFDFDQHEDSYYLAMEYVRGASLWELRQRCRALGVGMSPLLAAHIGAEVARALSYAHRLTDDGVPLEVVHRDVTPHNVLISYEGAIKLGDFGIARAGKASTAPGMLKGKFAYMAPEQARGERVDGRCDVFALGVVLWELLTGGRPFEAESDLAVLRAVQQRVIPPPRRLNPEVPKDLDAVVMRALERNLDQRWPDARTFGRALEQVVLTHRQTPEDTDVAAFLEQVLGPAAASAPKLEAAGASVSLSELQVASVAPGAGAEAMGAAPWVVSEPTPALQDPCGEDPVRGAPLRRSDRDTEVASPPGRTAAGAVPEDAAHPRRPAENDATRPSPAMPHLSLDGVDSRSAVAVASLASPHISTLTGAALPLDGEERTEALDSPTRPTRRATTRRAVIACGAALVMAGPAIFLMARVTEAHRSASRPVPAGPILPLGLLPAPEGPSLHAPSASVPSDPREPEAIAEGGEAQRSSHAATRPIEADATVVFSDIAPEDAPGQAGVNTMRTGEAPRAQEQAPSGPGTGTSALLEEASALDASTPASRAPGSSETDDRAASTLGVVTGVVLIEVFPEADLELDGSARGRVRGRQAFRLPVGPHTVVLRHPHRSERFEIEIRRGARTYVRFNAFHAEAP